MAQINTCELHITVSEPLDIISIDHEPTIENEFYVEFQILDIIRDEPNIPRVISLVHKRFFLERSRFRSEEDVGGYIGSDLRAAGLPVPAQEWVLESVSSFSRRLSGHNVGVVPIKICLLQKKDRVNYVHEEDLDDVDDVSEDVLGLDLGARVASAA